MGNTGGYEFLVTVNDGAKSGGGADHVRVKVWNASTGAVVYDNFRGAADERDPHGADLGRFGRHPPMTA